MSQPSQYTDLWGILSGVASAATTIAKPLAKAILATSKKMVSDEHAKMLQTDAAALMAAMGKSSENPARAFIDMTYAVADLAMHISSFSYKYFDEVTDITKRAQELADVLMKFAQENPEVADAATKLAGMIAVDPKLSVFVLLAEAYLHDRPVDLNHLDLKMFNAPAQVMLLISTVRAVLPVATAMEMAFAVGYLKFMHKPHDEERRGPTIGS